MSVLAPPLHEIVISIFESCRFESLGSRRGAVRKCQRADCWFIRLLAGSCVNSAGEMLILGSGECRCRIAHRRSNLNLCFVFASLFVSMLRRVFQGHTNVEYGCFVGFPQPPRPPPPREPSPSRASLSASTAEVPPRLHHNVRGGFFAGFQPPPRHRRGSHRPHRQVPLLWFHLDFTEARVEVCPSLLSSSPDSSRLPAAAAGATALTVSFHC